MGRSVNKLQTDWFDFFFKVPIQRKFVRNGEFLETLDDIAANGCRVVIVEVVAGGYLITTKENDNERKQSTSGNNRRL